MYVHCQENIEHVARLLTESSPHALMKARFVKGCKNTVQSLKWLLLGFDPERATQWSWNAVFLKLLGLPPRTVCHAHTPPLTCLLVH
jgi:hypothetical protein